MVEWAGDLLDADDATNYGAAGGSPLGIAFAEGGNGIPLDVGALTHGSEGRHSAWNGRLAIVVCRRSMGPAVGPADAERFRGRAASGSGRTSQKRRTRFDN